MAIAVFSAGVVFADPFSGMIVEGALGSSQIKSDGRSVNVKTGQNDGGTNFNNEASYFSGVIPLSEEKESGFSGRLGVGYGYTLPGTNFNLAGLLTTNIGQQKMKETATQFNGPAFDAPIPANADAVSGWKRTLKNVVDLRLQPGYYILPLRTLVYGTLGYSSAKLDATGRTIWGWSSNRAGNGQTWAPVGQGSVNIDGLVLGIGAKYSPIARLYVGIDYSHTSYKSKNFSGMTSANAGGGGTFPVQWETNTGKIKTDAYLLTVGYYFF